MPILKSLDETMVILLDGGLRGEMGLPGTDGVDGEVTTAQLNTALAVKANDSGVVHNTGTETVAGVKTFTSPIKITGGSPGAGKALTSDATGNATWVIPVNTMKIYNVLDYGAVMNTTSNQTTAIQAAIDAAAADGGGIVWIPTGRIEHAGLILKQYVILTGNGKKNTQLVLRNNSNVSSIRNYISPDGIVANALFTGVMNIYINGNQANQTSTSHGIEFSTNPLGSSATNDAHFDSHQFVKDVHIYKAHDDGINATGRGEMRFVDVWSSTNYGYGINSSFDTFISLCTADHNGLSGIATDNGDIMISSCKSFVNNDAGFLLKSPGLTAMVGCTAQNNLKQGFFLDGAKSVSMQGCVADSNNFGVGNANDAYAGVELNNAKYNVVDFVSSQGFQSGVQIGNQYIGVRINNGSDYNTVRLSHTAQTGYTAGPPVSTDSIELNNEIIANGERQSVLHVRNPSGTVAALFDTTNNGSGDTQYIGFVGNRGRMGYINQIITIDDNDVINGKTIRMRSNQRNWTYNPDGSFKAPGSISSNYTITAVDLLITPLHQTVEVTVASKIITLPTAVGIAGRSLTVINTNAGSTTVAADGTETIGNGTTPPTTITVTTGSAVTIVSNGTNWRTR
jgi:parallel beta helix pectate lyase-like protein